MTTDAAVPEGFVRNERRSPVTEPWEPIWMRKADRAVQLGIRVTGAHCNSRHFVHGGVIASLADNAMGWSVGLATGGAGVTVTLAIDYVRSATTGQWLQVEPRVIRADGKLGFVDALVTADGETIARANATFRVFP